MTMRQRLLAGVFLAAGVLVVALSSGAAENKEKDESSQVINDIVTAHRLEALGREQKAPELLIAAAELLRDANHDVAGKLGEISEKPVNDKDEPVKADTEKTPSLEQQANDLFEEATGMAADNAKLSGAILTLVKAARDRKPAGTRNAVGGPRNITRSIEPGEAHVYNIPFHTDTMASFGFNSGAPLNVRVKSGDNVLFQIFARDGFYNWQPAPASAPKTFHFRVSNDGRKRTTYTLYTN